MIKEHVLLIAYKTHRIRLHLQFVHGVYNQDHLTFYKHQQFQVIHVRQNQII